MAMAQMNFSLIGEKRIRVNWGRSPARAKIEDINKIKINYNEKSVLLNKKENNDNESESDSESEKKKKKKSKKKSSLNFYLNCIFVYFLKLNPNYSPA